ncbi:hypothetical protein KY335_04920 [Candidatus Woesearchaeota archaeon]|nr:hypothetical protein [Candidatus Woesearchaeota archaeon]MBW3014551.1 hypothetical protein [Candidatus Woesearchaeota archaeon]
MKNRIIITAILVIIVILILVFVESDSVPTGQGINLRLPKETIKKITEEAKGTPSENTNTENKDYCNCPDPYNGKILTEKTGAGILTSLSRYDCAIIMEMAKMRKELNMGEGSLKSYVMICDGLDWS